MHSCEVNGKNSFIIMNKYIKCVVCNCMQILMEDGWSYMLDNFVSSSNKSDMRVKSDLSAATQSNMEMVQLKAYSYVRMT